MQTLEVEFRTTTIEFALGTCCCDIRAEVTITQFLGLRNDSLVTHEPYRYLAILIFVQRNSAAYCYSRLKLSVVHIFAIVRTDP